MQLFNTFIKENKTLLKTLTIKTIQQKARFTISDIKS